MILSTLADAVRQELQAYPLLDNDRVPFCSLQYVSNVFILFSSLLELPAYLTDVVQIATNGLKQTTSGRRLHT